MAFAIPRQHRVHRRFARAGFGPSRRRRQLPWVLGLCLFGIFAFGSVVASVGIVWGLVWFGQFAGALPPPENLMAHQPFQTTRVVAADRGTLLYEITDPQGGRRTVVTLDQVPRYLIEATIATEDPGFFSNPGFEPRSILRAGLDDLSHNGIVSGASTITQQVVRNVLLTPDERQQVSAARKIREIIVAYQLTQTYTKDQILQIYLNEINYGNRSYGIEAASVAYFGKSAVSLNLAECALLAGLPQAPSTYDPYVRPDEVKQRQLYVLQRMVEQGYLTQDEADAAGGETLTFIDSRHAQVAPHFVAYVSDLLDRQLGTDALYHGGDTAITTLDPQLQASAERAVNQNLDALHRAGGNNTAVVALDPQTGHVLAMVGSAGFDDSQIAGEVNMTLAEHQSGGVLSPLTYAVALQQGKTLIDRFEIRQNGPNTVAAPAATTSAATVDPQVVRLTLRDALGRDLTAPANQLMGTIGNQSFLDLGTRIGLANFNQRVDYGVNQRIAGAHVTPLEVARVYATLANGGVSRPPITIERIVGPTGSILFQADASGQNALDPGVAFLVTSVLADPAMRSPEILPGGTGEQPVATRVSLAEDQKDAWAVGYTPGLVVVVWTGNSNGRALTDAGPAARILNDLVSDALPMRPAIPFEPPPDVVQMALCQNPGCSQKQTLPVIRGTERVVESENAAAIAVPIPSVGYSRTPLVDRTRAATAGAANQAATVSAPVAPAGRTGLITLPDVSGASPEQARVRLVSAGFQVASQIQYVPGTDLSVSARGIAVGQVVGTSPAAGQQVAAGASVVLTVRRN